MENNHRHGGFKQHPVHRLPLTQSESSGQLRVSQWLSGSLAASLRAKKTLQGPRGRVGGCLPGGSLLARGSYFLLPGSHAGRWGYRLLSCLWLCQSAVRASPQGILAVVPCSTQGGRVHPLLPSLPASLSGHPTGLLSLGWSGREPVSRHPRTNMGCVLPSGALASLLSHEAAGVSPGEQGVEGEGWGLSSEASSPQSRSILPNPLLTLPKS